MMVFPHDREKEQAERGYFTLVCQIDGGGEYMVEMWLPLPKREFGF